MKLIDPISRHLCKASRSKGPIMLMYHSVKPGRGTPDWLWSVSLKNFTDQMELLRQSGWNFRKVSDFKPENHLERSIAITFDDGYLDNFEAFEVLAKNKLCGTWFVVSGNVGRPSAWADPDTAGWPMLDGGALREMVQAGMEIGGHSRHHYWLAEIPVSDLVEEISGCRVELEDILGSTVTSFAYPYGSFNDDVVGEVEKAGYQVACTTKAGLAFADNNAFRLRRIAIYATDNLSTFARKMGLARNKADWGRVADDFLNK